MFDIAWSHILLLAIIALIFIGPKELPIVLRTLGRWVGKMRVLVREFQEHLEELADSSEDTLSGEEKAKIAPKRKLKR
jgi:sec-independent protein translocase protein TatB